MGIMISASMFAAQISYLFFPTFSTSPISFVISPVKTLARFFSRPFFSIFSKTVSSQNGSMSVATAQDAPYFNAASINIPLPVPISRKLIPSRRYF